MSDLIKRADAIEAVRKVREKPEKYYTQYNAGVDCSIKALSSLPSADSEPSLKAIKRQIDEHWYLEPPSAEAVQGECGMIPIELKKRYPYSRDEDITDAFMRGYQAHAEAVQGWIPCSERLPKVNQRVLLATNDGRVFVGYREKPDLVWQVTEKDGRKHWVYDPENYTDDIEILPKNEDCGFSKDDVYSDGFLSVASVNYDDRFVGVTAWKPLPKPYTKGDNDEER